MGFCGRLSHLSIENRMARKPPLCRNCGTPMKGHSKSGCLIPKLQSITPSPEPKDDETSIISATPSFVIPETGLFRRQNPNYVLQQPPPPVETLVLSSASLTPTEPVDSANVVKRSFPPPLQQFTPIWSGPLPPKPSRRILKQQPPFAFGSTSPTALSPASVFGAQPGDSVRLVAAIYELPSTAVDSFRARALSNGIYGVPIGEPLRGSFSEERRMQDVDLPPSTWFVTGPMFSDVDALADVLRPRGLVWRISQIRLTAVMQVVRNLDVLHYAALALFLCVLKLIFNW